VIWSSYAFSMNYWSSNNYFPIKNLFINHFPWFYYILDWASINGKRRGYGVKLLRHSAQIYIGRRVESYLSRGFLCKSAVAKGYHWFSAVRLEASDPDLICSVDALTSAPKRSDPDPTVPDSFTWKGTLDLIGAIRVPINGHQFVPSLRQDQARRRSTPRPRSPPEVVTGDSQPQIYLLTSAACVENPCELSGVLHTANRRWVGNGHGETRARRRTPLWRGIPGHPVVRFLRDGSRHLPGDAAKLLTQAYYTQRGNNAD
jgi:hypothetical protein